MTPTDEQQAVIDFVSNSTSSGKKSLIVHALAGSAKTTTLKMSAQKLPAASTKKLALAFNVRIKDDLSAVLSKDSWDVLTLNGLGHRAISKLLGRSIKISLDKNKIYRLVKAASIHEMIKKDVRVLTSAAKTFGLVPDGLKYSMSKKFLEDSETSWQELAEFSGVNDAIMDPDWAKTKGVDIIQATRDILAENIKEAFAGIIDFSDQLYISSCFSGSFDKYPLVFVDETQDLSALNHYMVRQATGARLIAVGDENQSIYSFRGADSNSMSLLRDKMSMDRLDLTTCFRCAKAVVIEAQQYTPHMKFPSFAKDGKVEHLNKWTLDDIPPGSAVLCRNNAPLVGLFFAFAKLQRPVQYVGSNILERVEGIVHKICGGKDYPRLTLQCKMREHLDALPEDKQDFFCDIVEIVEVTPGENTEEVLKNLKLLFSANQGSIILCTGHRSKGSEWGTVFHLDSWRIPSKYAKTDAAKQQEKNLAYVITTRAKERLVYVNMDELER